MHSKRSDPTKTAELDDMSRDLLLLTRTVGIYPEGHPQVGQLSRRLTQWARGGDAAGISVGVTGSELVVNGQFFGGRDTRIEILSRHLHRRQIARIQWSPDVTENDVYGLARILSTGEIVGQQILAAMEAQGVENIRVVPLDIEALHERLRMDTLDADHSEEERRRQLWQWLQEVSGNPKQLGRMLAGEDFWAGIYTEHAELRSEMADFLSGLGVLIDRALQTVPEENRARILDHLAHLGQALPPDELARLVEVHLVGRSPTEQSLAALLRHVQGERLAGVLGGLVAMGGAKEERVTAFVRRYVPPESLLGLVGLVRDWQGMGEKMGFASEIWRWLEHYLLDLDENEYLGEGYRETLDRMALRLATSGEAGASFGFFEDPQFHLDRVYVGMTMARAHDAGALLNRRIDSRLEELDGVSLLEFLELIEATCPDVLADREDLFERLLGEVGGGVKDFSAEVRARLIGFLHRNEGKSLSILLKALSEESRLSMRRFLVEALCHASPGAVPIIVQTARTSPWFVVRNLSIVLGRLRDPRAAPFLRSLLEHENAKVRKEAIRSLGFMDQRARGDLMAYSLRMDRPADERRMAQLAAERIKAP